MFLSGEWDATSTLLENKNLIEKKINDLPYIKFNHPINHSKPNNEKLIPPD